MDRKNKKGMTLIELIVAMGIFMVVLTMLTSIFISIIKAQRQYFALQDVQENARHVVETMTKEIRMSRIESCSIGSDYFSLLVTAFNDQYPSGIPVLYDVVQSPSSGRVERNSVSIISSRIKVSSAPSCFAGGAHPRLTFVIPLLQIYMPNTEIKIQNTLSSRYLFTL